MWKEEWLNEGTEWINKNHKIDFMTRITEVRLVVKYLRINDGGEVVRDIYTYLWLRIRNKNRYILWVVMKLSEGREVTYKESKKKYISLHVLFVATLRQVQYRVPLWYGKLKW